jgi:serine-type D-Ala-D-Ala carboxypeptidase (penicillin-binding protein 5/6)
MDYCDIIKALPCIGWLWVYCAFYPTWADSVVYQPILPPPVHNLNVSLKGYLLMDAQSGLVITASESPMVHLAPASLTKMMTMYVISHALRKGQLHLADQVSVSQKAGTLGGSSMFLVPGTRAAVQDLIQGIIVQSGNDASIALAEHVSGSEEGFVRLMNQQAQALGMRGTYFSNASGLPHAMHYTTPLDMALLARAMIREFPEYYRWYSQKSFRYNQIEQLNRNRLLWLDNSVDGIKTGETQEAGYCLAASARRQGRRLIAMVMGAPSKVMRAEAAQILLNYGFNASETHIVYKAGECINSARLWYGQCWRAPIGVAQDLSITVPRGTAKQAISARMIIQKPLIAPLREKDIVGEIHVLVAGRLWITAPLVMLAARPSGFWAKQVLDCLMLFIKHRLGLSNLPAAVILDPFSGQCCDHA